MDIGAGEIDMGSVYAVYQARNDADKWTKCESLIGLDHSQLFLQRVDLTLQGGNSCL